jgi:MtN3 and saliva related transmembrane protein
MLTNVLGFLAAILTTSAFVPQVVKTWKTRSAGDLSLVWLLAFTTGVACWLAYSLILGVVPMMVGNGVTLALALVLLFLKITDRSRKRSG